MCVGAVAVWAYRRDDYNHDSVLNAVYSGGVMVRFVSGILRLTVARL